MIRSGILSPAAVLLLVLASCSREANDNSDMLPLAARVISDTSSAVYGSVRHFAKYPEKGVIAVVGEPEDVIGAVETFLTFDMYDNISGRVRSDALPDFAGETVAACLDIAGSPYSRMVDLSETVRLRELCVRQFLLSIDTLAYASASDRESVRLKPRAKAVVFASGYASAYGAEDVDSLCRRTGCNVAVYSPVKSMLEHASQLSAQPLNIAVWADAGRDARNVYALSIPKNLAALGLKDAEWQTFVPYEDEYTASRTVKEKLVELLDMYIATESEKPLSTIMLDAPGIGYDNLKSALEDLRNSSGAEYLPYRRLLRQDIAIVAPSVSMARACFGHFRRTDAFTHKVAYPGMNLFFTAESQDGGPAVLVGMNERHFPTDLMDFMEANAPKSFSLYVR